MLQAWCLWLACSSPLPGAILGLLSAFGGPNLPTAAKVGLLALALELLISFVLFGLIVAEKPAETKNTTGQRVLNPFFLSRNRRATVKSNTVSVNMTVVTNQI